MNCKNCGAPLTGAKCEYCGSVSEEFALVDFEKKLNQWKYEEAKRELIRAQTQINNIEQPNYILARINSNFEPMIVEPYHSFAKKHNKLVERLVNHVRARVF